MLLVKFRQMYSGTQGFTYVTPYW